MDPHHGRAYSEPRQARPHFIRHPTPDPTATAVARVRALGFSPEDVRDLVLTHLDLDHAGGMADFPHARVHVYGPEHDAATRRSTWLERERYRTVQWDHQPTWVRHGDPGAGAGGERWMGFDAVRALEGTDAEVLLVPLPGHTRGPSRSSQEAPP